uniref:ZP domain-containing protein n=1 Tax=Ciona savignyi TaxID=51511 RepID=H2YPU7_CIOSA
MRIQHVTLTLLLVFSAFCITFGQQQDDACSGVTCNNKGTCDANPAYTRGYWCECDDGWAGQDCNHPEPTVRCADDRIDVVIDKGLVQELQVDDDARYVYFGKSSAGQQCRATDEGNLYKLSILAPFSNCGTQVIQRGPGDDYTFSNTVVWNREVNNTQNLIDREMVLLDFKCIYEDTYTVSGPAVLPTLNVLKFQTGQGRFEVRMSLFDDNSYSRSHEYTEQPTIAIGTYVYVQVELAYVADPNLVVTMDRCFASQSRDPADPVSTKHMLIVNRCANPNDTTVQVRFNGENRNSQFKFQMFKWRWSADDVFLHCEVDICNRTSEVCTGSGIDCRGLGQFRRKREALTHEGQYDPDTAPPVGHFVSQGPIHVKWEPSSLKSASAGDDQVDKTMVILGSILGFVLIALGVIVGAIIRRRQLRQKNQRKLEASEATTKRFTSLHFTTEAF